MSEAIITEEHAGMTIEIHHDDDPMNPLTDWDHAGHILSWARDFDGDESIRDPESYITECERCEGSGYDPTGDVQAIGGVVPLDCLACGGMGEVESDAGRYFAKEYDGALTLPLRFEDHGSYGARIYVTDWDSNPNAVYLFTQAELESEWFPTEAEKGGPGAGVDGATKYATAMLSELSDYYQGNVYGYVVLDPDGEHLDSCWGFIGEPWDDDSYIMAEARSAAEYGAEKVAQEATEAFRAACSDVVTV